MTRKQEAPEVATPEIATPAKAKAQYEVRAELGEQKLTMLYTTRNSALTTKTQLVAAGWTVKILLTKEIV